MDDRTEDRILDKADYVREAVTLLAEKRDALTFEQYRASREDRDVVEREFETAIEACIDIGKMLLRDHDIEVPETNAAVFRALETEGILESETAQRMAQAAGFRNILSHKYGEAIDDRDVYNFLQHELPLFHEFLEAVRKTLD